MVEKDKSSSFWDFTRNMSIKQAEEFNKKTKGMTLKQKVELITKKNKL